MPFGLPIIAALSAIYTFGCTGADHTADGTRVIEIRLMDSVVGRAVVTEEQVDGQRELTSNRSYSMWVAGAEVDAESATVVRMDDHDRLISYSRTGQFGTARREGFPGAVYWLEEARGPLTRAVAGEEQVLTVLEPVSLDTMTATVVPVDSDTVAWRTRVASGEYDLDPDGRVLVARQGPVTLKLVDSLPSWERADVAKLLGRPAVKIDRPRHVRVLVVSTEEGSMRTEAPLRAEIPKAPVVEVDPQFAKWLRPAPGIEVGEPALVREAEKMLRGAEDRRAAVELLTHRVNRRLSHTAEPGLPSALGALASGSGDCNEHAALFVGLARSSGMPARRISGLVYLDKPAPGFYPHEWVDVWMGEPVGWVAVDPALAQPIADAARIPLATEGRQPLWSVLDRLQRLSPEIVEVR